MTIITITKITANTLLSLLAISGLLRIYAKRNRTEIKEISSGHFITTGSCGYIGGEYVRRVK